MRRQKLRCYRVVEILRSYTLYHMMRRWRRQASFETAVREKSKIDGAYILIKRFKNRLKALDQAVERLHTLKANQVEVNELRAATSQERAQSVMDDMKLLFDTTTKEFEKKLQAKIAEVEKTYDRIIEKQKSLFVGFEMKYSNKMNHRLKNVEQFMDSIAIEQARLAEETGTRKLNARFEASA